MLFLNSDSMGNAFCRLIPGFDEAHVVMIDFFDTQALLIWGSAKDASG